MSDLRIGDRIKFKQIEIIPIPSNQDYDEYVKTREVFIYGTIISASLYSIKIDIDGKDELIVLQPNQVLKT